MNFRATRLPVFAVTIMSAAGLIVFSACSGAGAESATNTDPNASVVAQTLAPTPTPTVVSNVPFPLDPGPSTANQGSTNGVTGNAGSAPNQTYRRHEDDREGREGGEGREFGERGSIQRVAVSVNASGIQLSSAAIPAGPVEFDLTNNTSQPQHVLITGNGVNGDSGVIAPGVTVHLQGTLPAGSYQLAIDTSTSTSAVPGVTLQVQ